MRATTWQHFGSLEVNDGRILALNICDGKLTTLILTSHMNKVLEISAAWREPRCSQVGPPSDALWQKRTAPTVRPHVSGHAPCCHVPYHTNTLYADRYQCPEDAVGRDGSVKRHWETRPHDTTWHSGSHTTPAQSCMQLWTALGGGFATVRLALPRPSWTKAGLARSAVAVLT